MAIAAPVLAILALAGPSSALEAGLAARAPGPERAVWASGLLLGARYRLSPLGEETPPDPDPRFRLDAFDCVTLVETAIALGNARTLAEARRLLDDVRYHGPPDFAHRNHYVEAQWLPANAGKGWIEDVTERIAGDLVLRGEKRLDPAAWRAAERAGAVLPDLDPSRRPIGVFTLPFVPLDHLAAVAPRIPEGTLLLLVREDRLSRPYRVTHMGIVVSGPGGRRALRHASDARGALRVRDEPIERFVARVSRWEKWRAVGASLWAIRENGERARALLGAPGAER